MRRRSRRFWRRGAPPGSVACRACARCTRWFRSCARPASWRRDDGPQQLTGLERFVAEYRDWLVGERGLAETTVIRYERLARRFMAGRVTDDGELDVAGLTGADVSAFLLEECARVSVGSAKGRVAELRSLLRFLFLRGFTDIALADSVPSVAGWRNTEIPATMAPGDVAAAAGLV